MKKIEEIEKYIKTRRLSEDLLWCVSIKASPDIVIVFVDDQRTPDLNMVRSIARTIFYTDRMYQTSMWNAVKGRYRNTGAIFIIYDINAQHGVKIRNGSLLNQVGALETIETIASAVTLKDLVGQASRFTKEKQNERRAIQGTARNNVTYVGCELYESDDYVIFYFKTKATKDGEKKQVVDPTNNFKLSPNRSGEYNLLIMIERVFWYLDEFVADVTEGKMKVKDMGALLGLADVRIFSDSPSFHWQGFNYWLTQLGGAMYPTTQSADFWDKIHGTAFIDKHWLEFLASYKRFLLKMAVDFYSVLTGTKWYAIKKTEQRAKDQAGEGND